MRGVYFKKPEPLHSLVGVLDGLSPLRHSCYRGV